MKIEKLNKTKIESFLSANNQEKLTRLDVLPTIDSTNSYLLSQAKTYSKSGFVCIAEEQTAGRGRQGKVWLSPADNNIYCSLLWKFPGTHANISSLSLAVAVIVLKTLQRAGVREGLQLKWPNDIYYANRKLAGILIEAIPARDINYPVVIGIGINLNLPDHDSLTHPAAGLNEILNVNFSRNQLAGILIDELLTMLPFYLQQGFLPFLPTWRKHDMLQGKTIKITDLRTDMTGVAEEVNEMGELVICDAQGNVHSFVSGEVSVKSI